jgi:PKD repeat protein
LEYAACLAINSVGNECDANDTIKVVVFPSSSFTESTKKVLTNEIVYFNASDSYDPDGNIIDYFWDFGDGTNATGQVVTHAYNAEGNFTITLTIIDDDGSSSNSTTVVTAINLHDVEITGVTLSATQVYNNQSVTIYVTVENKETSRETFNVTTYYDENVIDTQLNISLSSRSNVTLPFVWDVTNVAVGNYTISAQSSMSTEKTYSKNKTSVSDSNVIPEFSTWASLSTLMLTTLLIVLWKKPKKSLIL